MDTKSERELIRRCRDGSTSAFEPLVRDHQQQALRLATALLGDGDEAADAVRDAFVRAFRSLNQLKDGGTFGPWFRSILRRHCIDRMRSPARRQARLEEVNGGQWSEPAYDFLEREELSAIVRRALQLLSPEHREVLVLKEIEGMSYAEIASAAAIPEGTVGSRVYHARLALKKILLHRGITAEEVG